MNFWNVLDIEPTYSASEVKKAYAKKLKLHHPEDDPEGYQKLREAYDSALKYIKNKKKKEAIDDIRVEKINEMPFKEEVFESNNELLPHVDFSSYYNEVPSFEKSVEVFITKVQILYNDFFSRINVEKWMEILNSEVIWYMGEMEKVLNECKAIESIGFDNWDFKLLAAKCYLYFKEDKKAKELLVQFKAIVRLKTEAENLLEQVNLELVRKLRKSDKKNKEIRLEIDGLYKELGRLTDSQLKRKLKRIFIRRLIIFLVLLLIQIINIQSAMKNMGVKDYHSLNNTLKFMMFWGKGEQVNSSKDIDKLPMDIGNVQGKLTDAAFLSLYRIPIKDKQGQIKEVYLSYDTAKKRNLYGDMNGYLCVGTLGDKKIVAVLGYKEATQAYKSKTIDFDSAVLHKITDTKLLNKIEKLYGTKTFVTDRFIDTEVTVSGSRKHTLKVDTWLLFIQLAFILLGVTSAIKLIRVNRK